METISLWDRISGFDASGCPRVLYMMTIVKVPDAVAGPRRPDRLPVLKGEVLEVGIGHIPSLRRVWAFVFVLQDLGLPDLDDEQDRPEEEDEQQEEFFNKVTV